MNEHCLRVEFTYQLLESLLQGKSINLIAPHGQGRRRTLQDLRSILPEAWRVFQVDMRDVEKRQISLLHALLEQRKYENITNIHDFMAEMNKTSTYHLVIIHNLEFLTDLSVISCLNDMEKYPYVSLLYVSEKRQQELALLVTDYILPVVTSKQLLAEIRRRDFLLKDKDRVLLVDFLLEQPSPYSLLDTHSEAWFSDGLWK
ncbi:MAG: hypothetical protein Q9M21_02325 [Mariprofundaceae bacterium]|nr:hypothetical protein [Mariprofundaceae bacterium]